MTSDKPNSKPKEQLNIGFRGGRGPHGGRFMPKVRAKDTKGVMARLWRYLSKKKGVLFLVFLLVLVSSAFNLAGPLLIGKAIDNYIIPGDLKGLAKMIFLMLAVYGAGALCTWFQSYSMIGIAQEAVMGMRKELFHKLMLLPLSFFDTRPHGDLMSRLTNDVDNVSNTLGNSVTQIFSSVITLVGTLAMMLYLSPLLTLFTVIVIPVIFLFTGLIAKRTRKFFVKQQESLGELNGFIEETISGQKVVKVSCRENESIEEFEKTNQKLRDVAIKAQIFSGIIPPLMGAIRNAEFVIVAASGGYLAIRGVITVGVIASFINYSKQFARPLNELANQFNMFQSALAGAERVFEIMDEKPETPDIPDAYFPETVKGDVSFYNVNFGYKKGIPVLKNISFNVKAGQTIALVGPTGSGKTTIVNLLTRFYDVEKGGITIDGRSIESYKKGGIRSSLGIVLQDTSLFSGTVRENIRYGRLSATDKEVEEASKLANAHYFIHRLPEGYDTIITEGGGNFSQGQRQMIAIARAILTNPAILILDEATSSVDTRTEAYIQEAMLALMKGRTCFVIAHRLSTIINADVIFVIKDGEIIERGTHKELIEDKGFYHNLYNSQFRRQAS